MNSGSIFTIVIAAIMLLLSVNYISKCSRLKPITEHQDNRKAIVKADSIKSVFDTSHRAQLDSLKQAYQDTLQDLKGKYKALAQKDNKVEQRYRKAPLAVTCDSVITSKNSRIAALETINTQYQHTDLMNDSIITSFQSSIRDKDQAIGQLNEGYKQATTDLQKAKKPKRFGLGVSVGYGIGQNVGPVPVVSIGLNYSLIRL